MFQKANTMRQGGFTLVELLCVLAIIGILIMVVAAQFGDEAHGAEIQKLMPADDTSVKEVVKLLRQDPHQTVIVLTYAANWVMDTIDPLMDESKVVFRTLIDAGIPEQRITWTFANKGGLMEDPMPTPPKDGVYLYLE